MKIKVNGQTQIINIKKKKSKFERYCEYLENKDYIESLPFHKRVIPEMLDYDLLQY